jgi:hypothetical protein
MALSIGIASPPSAAGTCPDPTVPPHPGSIPGLISRYPNANFSGDCTPAAAIIFNIGEPFGGLLFPQSPRNEFATAFTLAPGQSWNVSAIDLLSSLTCSTGVLLSLRMYSSSFDSRIPESMIYERLQASDFQDLGVINQGGMQFRHLRLLVQPSNPPFGNLVSNQGSEPIRIWFTSWGEDCLNQSTWNTCHPQLDTTQPAAFRCEFPLSCPTGFSANVWHDYTALARPLPNCPPVIQVLGSVLTIAVFSDGFES